MPIERHKPALAEGRCCWVCGRPGGAGFTTALRLAGYAVPARGVIAYAHNRCMVRAQQRYALREKHMSKAERLATSVQASRNYLRTLRRLSKLDQAHDCEHGHLGCAAEPQGACSDELLHLTEEGEE